MCKNLSSYLNVNVTGDGDGEQETSGEVTVGIGVNKNDFGVKVIDDGEGEDVNKGECVNVKDLGDGEADPHIRHHDSGNFSSSRN